VRRARRPCQGGGRSEPARRRQAWRAARFAGLGPPIRPRHSISAAAPPESRLHEPDTGIGLRNSEPDATVVAGGGAADGDVAGVREVVEQRRRRRVRTSPGQRTSQSAAMAMAAEPAHDLARAKDLAGRGQVDAWPRQGGGPRRGTHNLAVGGRARLAAGGRREESLGHDLARE
jgi:hypothetical protein